MKTTVSEINTMNESNSRLYIAEENISELEDIAEPSIQNETQ